VGQAILVDSRFWLLDGSQADAATIKAKNVVCKWTRKRALARGAKKSSPPSALSCWSMRSRWRSVPCSACGCRGDIRVLGLFPSPRQGGNCPGPDAAGGRRLEDRLSGESVELRLLLDRKACLERDQRRKGGHGGAQPWGQVIYNSVVNQNPRPTRWRSRRRRSVDWPTSMTQRSNAARFRSAEQNGAAREEYYFLWE